MTLFSPTLIVERMRIERDGLSVFDEKFHEGVNVVRGDNSSGKSTVLNFIFYGLGGDLNDWSAVARLCTRVLLQVRFNGRVATLSREVSDKARTPMDVFAGEIDQAVIAQAADWLRFGYARSAQKESFSQAIFRLLDMPDVASEASGNITVNQYLRLLYADQLSPVESIFKFQGAFDEPALRDAVGRLMFGAHSHKYYNNIQEIKKLNKQLDEAVGEYRSLVAAADEVSDGLTIDWVAGRTHEIRQSLEKLEADREVVERNVLLGEDGGQVTLDAQDAAYAALIAAQEELQQIRRRQDQLAVRLPILIDL